MNALEKPKAKNSCHFKYKIKLTRYQSVPAKFRKGTKVQFFLQRNRYQHKFLLWNHIWGCQKSANFFDLFNNSCRSRAYPRPRWGSAAWWSPPPSSWAATNTANSISSHNPSAQSHPGSCNTRSSTRGRSPEPWGWSGRAEATPSCTTWPRGGRGVTFSGCGGGSGRRREVWRWCSESENIDDMYVLICT